MSAEKRRDKRFTKAAREAQLVRQDCTDIVPLVEQRLTMENSEFGHLIPVADDGASIIKAYKDKYPNTPEPSKADVGEVWRLYRDTIGINVLLIHKKTNDAMGDRPVHLLYNDSEKRPKYYSPERYEAAKKWHDTIVDRMVEDVKRLRDNLAIVSRPFPGDHPELIFPGAEKFIAAKVWGGFSPFDSCEFISDGLEEFNPYPGEDFTWRPHQLSAIKQLIKEFPDQPRNKGWVIYAPCAAGKTVIGTAILKHFFEQNPRGSVVLMTPDTTLFEETWAKNFNKANIQYNAVGNGRRELQKTMGAQGEITIAMEQTIASMFKNQDPAVMDAPSLVVIDEAHLMHYSSFLRHWQENGTLVVMVTASPRRTPRLRFFAHEKVIVSASKEDLIEQGYIEQPILQFHGDIDRYEEVIRLDVGTFNERVIDATIEAILAYEKEHNEVWRGMVLATNIDHALSMEKRMNSKLGWAAAQAFASKNKYNGDVQDIKNILSGRRLLTRIAIVVDRFRTGFDCPILKNAIISRRGMSKDSIVQFLGRIERGVNGLTKNPLAIDLGGNFLSLMERSGKDIKDKMNHDSIYNILGYVPKWLAQFQDPVEVEEQAEASEPKKVDGNVSAITIPTLPPWRGVLQAELPIRLLVSLKDYVTRLEIYENMTDHERSAIKSERASIVIRLIEDVTGRDFISHEALRHLFENNGAAKNAWEKKMRLPSKALDPFLPHFERIRQQGERA